MEEAYANGGGTVNSDHSRANDSLVEASLLAQVAADKKQSQPKVHVEVEYQKPKIDIHIDPPTPVTPSHPPTRPSVLRLSLLDSYYLANMTTTNKQQNFDVVDTYKRLLADDPELTMPVAAIEALVLALAHTPATTVSETLDLLSTLTAELKARIPNPISLSAGTDLFQRYIITTLQKPSAGRNSDFDTIRTHLVQNGRLFVERAKEARDKIAGFGRHFVRDGNTVLTNGGSRVVGALLRSAAETSAGFGAQGSIRFRVIYVVSDSSDAESSENIAQLRKLGIPVATIPPTAIAYSLNQVSQCFVGAEGVVENGGIISRLGTYQIAMLAKAANKPFYVVSESHKFVRLYPLGQTDLGIDQNLVEFKTTGDSGSASGSVSAKDEGVADMDSQSDVGASDSVANNDAVDFTPPNLISGIITESGVLLPSAVSEELIKIWF
ncbi:nagb/rpia/CoA transferase-like protein [Aureobasidium pullulans]|uniref:Translation initiation factor eIF2B subunit alpha n=1 Tax=Aureobasidium pullulans TaxID=5580 RepID=A0A4S8YJZ7_AURPU|nr:nagb/rpia/CoA transferase-like protein [Aureobasidium pullulans]THX35184.1 nagb/rpia/CoA transferase-like protein [Aureobasidium pullulans]